MKNTSILAAFETMWQHVVARLSSKADSDHTHDEYAAQTNLDSHVSNANIHVTSDEKTNINTAYTHSQSAHAPSNAERNVVVGIQKNGTDLSVNSSTRKVNITVPTQASDIGASPEGHGHDAATTSASGFMTSAMVTKLNGIEAGAQVNTITGIKGNSETSYRTGNVNITKANIGLGNVDNTSDANKPVSTAQQSAIDTSLASAKSYTDGKIDAIVGEGASATLDTIGEISAAITENQGMLTTLNNAIGNKVDKVSGKGLSTNDLTATLKSNYDTAYSHVSNTNNPHGVTLSQLGVSATADELNYVDGVTSNIQTQLNGKQASISGGASTIASSNLTASRALVSNSSGKVAVSAVTSTELGYLDGVTSAIQTQLDAKAPTGHGHDNATTNTAGFMSASDKTKLNGISEGADSVSFAQGLTSGAEVGTITINGSGTKLYAPLNTNTTYDLTTTQASGQNVKLNLVAGGSGSGTDSIEIKGGGATSVYKDTNSGAIVIESTDHDTTYGAAGTSLGLVKSGGDVTISSGTITVKDDSHNHVISNIDNLQAALDAKSDSDHTHNYAGSSTAGGAATSANKVNSSLTVKLNSGTTEGTNMFTFNGSGAKSINITPSAIGASASGHNHDDRYYTETEIDTMLSGKASTSVATQSANGLMSSTDKTKLDLGGVAIVTTAGTGAAYTATVDGMTSLVVGAKITIIPHTNSTAYAPTLNVNSLGAKAIRMPVTYNTSATSNGVLENWIVSGKPITVQYNGTYWLTIDLPRPSAQYLYGTVPIANGGTGGTTAAEALTNLGAASSSHTHTSFTDIEVGSIDTGAYYIDKLPHDSTSATKVLVGNVLEGLMSYRTPTEIISDAGITATAAELNYCDGATSNIQIQLDSRAKIVLLWENSSKTSSFASQTLNLGLGSYNMYIVVARYSSAVGGTISTICKTGYSSRLQGVGSSVVGSDSTDETVSQESIRTVTYNGGSLNIGNAMYQGVQKNDALIPIFIYGIKGVS